MVVKRILVLLSALLLVLAAPTLAGAAELEEVADQVARDGFYVESGATISEGEAGALVGEMRASGEAFSLVVLSEEPLAGATTFADGLVDRLGQLFILVIAPDTIGYAGQPVVYTEEQLEAALDAAIEGDDREVATAFVGELTGVTLTPGQVPVPVPSTTIVDQTAAAEASGGGFSLAPWLVLAGIALFIWWMVRRSKAKRQVAAAARIDEGRNLVAEQLNDVANDLLAMEDEVRVAENDRVTSFYEQAAETYSDVTEKLPAATDPQELVELSNRVDVAIWQLDSAEAILDDKPLPERPEPKRLEAPPVPQPTPAPRAPTPRAPAPPTYERRPQRRSSYDGGGLLDLLIAVGGGMLSRRGRSMPRPSGGLGDMFNRPRSTPQSTYDDRPTPVPGPGRRATPTPPSPSTRGTSRRVRSGRRRRKR